MVKVVIEINGVRHGLVPDPTLWFDCGQCSLADLCRTKNVLLCNYFERSNHHFEVQRG